MFLSKAFNTSQTSKHHVYIHGQDEFLDANEAWLHEEAAEEGGQSCCDAELINSQRRIIIDIGKQLGRKLMAGNLNLINITLPVVMFEPRSYLQKLADPWVHPVHLEAAAVAASPLERLKLCVTWFVAGLQHVFSSWRKPFNPILGETWQASLPSGSTICCEQISHHPPITAFHVEGPCGLFCFDGLSQPEVSFSGGGLKTSARGYRRITFASNGAVIEIQYPYYRIGGLLSGVPHGLIKGTATLTDTKHQLTATVTFGPVAGATSALLARADSVEVLIHGPVPAAAAAVIAVPGWVQHAAAELSERRARNRTECPNAAAPGHAACEQLCTDPAAISICNASLAAADTHSISQDASHAAIEPSICSSSSVSIIVPTAATSVATAGTAEATQLEDGAALATPEPGTYASTQTWAAIEAAATAARPAASAGPEGVTAEVSVFTALSSSKLAHKLSLGRSRSEHVETEDTIKARHSKDSNNNMSHLAAIMRMGSSRHRSRSADGSKSSRSMCSSSRSSSEVSLPREPLEGSRGKKRSSLPASWNPVSCFRRSRDVDSWDGSCASYAVAATLGSRSSQGEAADQPDAMLLTTTSSPGKQAAAATEAAAAMEPSVVCSSSTNSRSVHFDIAATTAAPSALDAQGCVSDGSAMAPSVALLQCSSPERQPHQAQLKQRSSSPDALQLSRSFSKRHSMQSGCLQEQQLLSVGNGCWLSHLDFDGERYWTLADDPPEAWQPLQQQQAQQSTIVLPSDCQNRPDLVALRSDDVKQSQQLKEQLEEQQRKDARMRPLFPHISCAQAS